MFKIITRANKHVPCSCRSIGVLLLNFGQVTRLSTSPSNYRGVHKSNRSEEKFCRDRQQPDKHNLALPFGHSSAEAPVVAAVEVRYRVFLALANQQAFFGRRSRERRKAEVVPQMLPKAAERARSDVFFRKWPYTKATKCVCQLEPFMGH